MPSAHAATDHVITHNPNDDHAMFLVDAPTQRVIVTARRADASAEWEIHADGVDPVTASGRQAAIYAMTEHALASLHGHGDGDCDTCAEPLTGFSTTVSHGLADLGCPCEPCKSPKP